MDNFKRGDNALEALRATGAYEELENTLDYTLPTPEGDEVPGDPGYPISDLIADLLHLATRYEIDPMSKINEAIEHWGADILEQAFENDDENWSNRMQDENNIVVAESVLEINSVPKLYWPGIMVKVGMVPPDSKSSYEDGI